MEQYLAQYIYGLHEGDKDNPMPKPSWIVETVAIGHNPNNEAGSDFSGYQDTVICRLNNGYYPDGTLPLATYYNVFAQRVQNFVKNTTGCDRFIIGNEPNMAIERPQGQAIFIRDYVRCFNLCYDKIKTVNPNAQVILGAVAPWNVETGDWLDYFYGILSGTNPDRIALHTYTHGSDPALIRSTATMDDAPYQDRFYHFRAFEQFVDIMAQLGVNVPIYITETNQNYSWLDQNNGWCQEAYRYIDEWNKRSDYKVHCLALYRWPKYDQWYIKGKDGVIADFQEAINHGYTIGDNDIEMPDTNYTENPTFQPPYYEDGAGEKKVAQGWKTFYDASKRRWEWRQSAADFEYSQQWFETSNVGDGGIFQRVNVGKENASKYAHFVCQVALKSENTGSGIGEYYASIGIDRVGNADPFNDQTVEWTTPLHQAYCPAWTTLEKTARIENEWITVYLRAYNKYGVDGSMFVKSAYLYVIDDPCDGQEPSEPDAPETPTECQFDDSAILQAIENAKQEMLDAMDDVVKVSDKFVIERQ